MNKILKYKSDIIGYISSIMMMVGTIVPIITINGDSQAFISENGKLVLACAVISIILYLFKVGFLSFIPAIGSLLILFIFYNGINDSIVGLNNISQGTANYSIGFYLIIIGSILLIISSIINFIDYIKNKKSQHANKIDTTSPILDSALGISDVINNSTESVMPNQRIDLSSNEDNNELNSGVTQTGNEVGTINRIHLDVTSLEDVNQISEQQSLQDIEDVNDNETITPISITNLFKEEIEKEEDIVGQKSIENIDKETILEQPKIDEITTQINEQVVEQIIQNPIVSESQFKKCNNCGATIRKEAEVCSFCNSKLIDNNV